MTQPKQRRNIPQADWNEVRRRMALVQAALEEGTVRPEQEKRRILKERAKILSLEQATSPAQNKVIEVVVFQLADEKYGMEAQLVREVYPLKELAVLPGAPAFVLGITSVRGQIVPVIDLKKFFSLPEKGPNELDKIVIVESRGMAVGIQADSVTEVISVAAEELQAPLTNTAGNLEKYLLGITLDRIAVLDTAKLLSDKSLTISKE